MSPTTTRLDPRYDGLWVDALSSARCREDCNCARNLVTLAQRLGELHPQLAHWHHLHPEDLDMLGPPATLESIEAERAAQWQRMAQEFGHTPESNLTTFLTSRSDVDNKLEVWCARGKKAAVAGLRLGLQLPVARDILPHWRALQELMLDLVDADTGNLDYGEFWRHVEEPAQALGVNRRAVGLLTYQRNCRRPAAKELHGVRVDHFRDGILLDGRQLLESQGVAAAAEACCRAVRAISLPGSPALELRW